MIDLKMFNNNCKDFDKQEIIELIELYLTLYEEEFITIRSCIVQKDVQKVAQVACKLKGIVSFFCDPVVTEQTKQLENMTRNNNKIEDGVQTLLDELEVSNGLMAEELKKKAEELTTGQK